MQSRAPVRARLAMAIVSSVVLLVQIAATRLLSATVAYHAAFAVLALVMLALAGSATAVYRDRCRRGNSAAGPEAAGNAVRPASVMSLVAGPVVAGTLIVPLGICMGTALPSGVAALSRAGGDRMVPWMWAINGLAGTLASVAGMLLAMEAGYTVLLLVSAAGYLVAWLALGRFARAPVSDLSLARAEAA